MEAHVSCALQGLRARGSQFFSSSPRQPSHRIESVAQSASVAKCPTVLSAPRWPALAVGRSKPCHGALGGGPLPVVAGAALPVVSEAGVLGALTRGFLAGRVSRGASFPSGLRPATPLLWDPSLFRMVNCLKKLYL